MSKALFNFNNINKLILFYLIYIFLISIISLLLSYLYILNNSVVLDNDLNIIIERIPFFWGPLTSNIYKDFSFTSEGPGFIFYLKKFPLNALFLAIIFKISKNIYIFMLIKNIISSSLIFFITYFFTKNNKKNYLLFLFLLSGFFIVPYNTSVIFTYVYADHLTSFLVPLLFLSLVSEYKKNYYLIGILIFTLYFTKPSMFFICMGIPFVLIFLEYKKKSFLKFVPFVFLLTAILLWGFYGLAKTGKFPFGKNLLSNNSHDFIAIANNDFIKNYPYVTVDTAQMLIVNDIINSNKFNSEWEYYDAFNKVNKKYLENNISEYLSSIPVKIKFIFFYIYRDNVQPSEFKTIGNKIRFSNLWNKFSLNLSLLITLFILLKNFKNIFNFKLEIYYLTLVVLNLIPLIYAWATNKHLVALYITSNLYLALKFLNKRKAFSN